MGDSKGSAFLHNGTIYYSPNSTRHVVVPTRVDLSVYQFTKDNARLDRFQRPQWWTPHYGYLAFVPLNPRFDGAAFGCLREISSHIRPSYEQPGSFTLSPEKAAQWMDLEDLLILVSSLVKNNRNFLLGPSIHPIAPSYLGYRRLFYSPRGVRLRATTARDWFVVLMAQLSFLLGHFEHDANLNIGNGLNFNVPRWFSYLESRGIAQSWLSSLQASIVCDFSSRCPRAGIFLDFLENGKGSQPTVKWYTFLNVPVWYPWTARHEKAVKENPLLGYLQPPPELLQAAAGFLIRTPTAALPSSFAHLQPYQPPPPQSVFDELEPPQEMHGGSSASNTSRTDYQLAQKAYLATKPWLKFFEARDVLNKKRLANETPTQRETRLNRERKPPIKKVDVFLWDWSDEDPDQLVRTKVTRREGEDILSSYSDSQLLYDSFTNVWDACDYMGQQDDDDDSESVFGGVAPPSAEAALPLTPIPPVVADDKGTSEQVEHEAFCRDRISLLDAMPPSERFKRLFLSFSSDSKLDLTQDNFDILGYLAFHYGFVPPLPLQSSSQVALKDWEENIKNVGLDISKNPQSVDLAAPIVGFLQGFGLAAGPSEELWDLRPGNRKRVDPQRLKQIISKQNDNLFFLSPLSLCDEPSCPWIIALTTAVDALFVYRLLVEKGFSAISLAYILIDEGIRFRTLQPLSPISIPSPIGTVRTVIPIRVKDYSFNTSDYHSYVRERARLLSSPRGRAALLEGGIIGRIAKEHLGHDSAALGPSSAITVHRQGFSFTDSAGTTYWDDKLTDNEILIICGLYHCYTGKTLSLYFYPPFYSYCYR